ncbi:ABC transporter permease subunit [Oribacterium sp. WCC10]|uniref:ABC transporter permease subunit n=1 Tax=Oribacterium sp. WCC10 TaxID=1855343 RepID=UPI0008EE508E|nr:ABC transporter permease subunit [Oribacterium sp. WCC10]SFG74172.1 polar amino acid transport system substrate-binding protein [Oribacterium sp. WCC10]
MKRGFFLAEKASNKHVRFFVTMLLMLIFCFTLSAFAAETPDWRSYNGKRIGVLTGTLMEDAAKEYFPDSEYVYLDSYPDCSAALLAGKIDAFLADEPNVKTMHFEEPDIDYIHDRIRDQDVSFAFRKDDPESQKLCDEFNAYLKTIKSNGILQLMDDIWMGVDESRKTVDMSGLSGTNGTVRVITTASDMPWSYIKDGINVGYDIDLMAHFCMDRGYALEIEDVSFAARIPALEAGKGDLTTGMNVTPERQEAVLFCDATYKGGIVLAVPSKDLTGTAQDTRIAASGKTPEFKTFDELKGKTISMITGAPFEDLILTKVSEVKEFTYFTTMPDMMLALKTGKTDAGLMNNAVAELAANKDPELVVFPEPLRDTTFGIGFKKGDERRDVWQEAFDRIPSETKDALWKKWTGSDDSVKTVPKQDWPGSNGVINVACCDSLEPMSYMGEGGECLGLDIETILLIAKELDVHVNFTPMDFSAVLSSLQADKADAICGSIVVTAERKESMDFLEYAPAAFVFIVRTSSVEEAGNTFIGRIKSSFEKTFIRENRYELFLSGVLTTIIITVLSIIFGTVFGFMVFMGTRRGNKAANAMAGAFVWLVQGMPVVVLLMILYYIVFAKMKISGTVVAVIAFTLVFGAGVFGMLRMGVGAVDKGQTEAALALGYGDIKSFFRIILPQAIPHFLPTYKGEVVALVKATAIVGYIAVQDLTKMGDIVRGRTYEAFFPLIAVAIIYFILGAILTFFVDKIEIGINPKRRKREDILKGVRTDD